MLPTGFSNETYWKEIYPQPLAYWQRCLDEITHHQFGRSMKWQRAALGRNIVFLNTEWVIKLTFPGWAEDVPREAAALAWLAGRLPVKTPELVDVGTVAGWSYILQRRLAGRNLFELWKLLSPEQRRQIAAQHGEILAALHKLEQPEGSVKHALAFDWEGMISEQSVACAEAMLGAGVSPALVEQVEGYIESAGLDTQLVGSEPILLHGDLTHLNFFVEPVGENWQITGLIDWGDAKLGPRGHEMISPGVHMYLGDPDARSAFLRSCGEAARAAGSPREWTARAMLYYAGEFPSLARGKASLEDCPDWDCVSALLWGLHA